MFDISNKRILFKSDKIEDIYLVELCNKNIKIYTKIFQNKITILLWNILIPSWKNTSEVLEYIFLFSFLLEEDPIILSN